MAEPEEIRHRVLSIFSQLHEVFRVIAYLFLILILVKIWLILEVVQTSFQSTTHSIAQWSQVSVEERKQVGQLLSKGDEILNNAVVSSKQFTLVVENSAKITQQLNDKTLPEATAILNQVRTKTVPELHMVLRDVSGLILVSGKSVEILTKDSDETIKGILEILHRPEILQGLENLESVTHNVDVLTENLGLTSQEIRVALPDLLAAFQKIEANTASATEATSKILNYIHEILTRKVSGKEKFFRAVLYALSYGLPIVIQTVRK